MKILGIIPSRYASTRFPGKPLARIGSKPMIQWVYEQASKSTRLDALVVATDDERIAQTVRGFGGQVLMTSSAHRNGTERCSEVLGWFPEYDYVINVQGDEPNIHPMQIDTLANLLDGQVELATLVKKIETPDRLLNPNTIKVVFNQKNEAIYFSRSPIPYMRDPQGEWPHGCSFYKHIGIYAYRSDVLQTITSLPPAPLETAESLEQLRWLENGYRIRVGITDYESIGVDSPEDLQKAIELLEHSR